MLENIYTNEDELHQYHKYPWFVNFLTGEVHQVIGIDVDQETGYYTQIKFVDGTIIGQPQTCDYQPCNMFILEGMIDHPKDKPYQLIFSGQYVKITKIDFLCNTIIQYEPVTIRGLIEHLGERYNVDVVTPEEYLVNTSSFYRMFHPELAEQYYIGS